MRVFVVGFGVLAWSATVVLAQSAELAGDSTGADWVAATQPKRGQWVVRAAAAIGVTGDPEYRFAARIAGCLNEALTPRTKSERLAVEAFKTSKLSELTAMCAALEMAKTKPHVKIRP